MTAPPVDGLLVLRPDAQDLLFRQARTANTFTDEPVTEEQIRAIYDLVKYGPTAINAQPLRILLLRSTQARERLMPHLSEANRPKTATASLVAILAADIEFHEHLPRVFPHRPEAKDGFVGPDGAAGREAHARFNAALQIGYFLIGVRAAGLAAGPITGFDAASVDSEFFGDRPLRSMLVVNLGRPGPDAWLERLPRLDHDEIVQTI